MKLTLQTQLLPVPEQVRALAAAMRAFNAAADWLAGEAFAARLANKIDLQRLHYRSLREHFGLTAQMAVRCIAQVCEAYKRDKSKRPRFRLLAAMPYDQRLMTFRGSTHVSLATLDGRMLMPVVMGDYQKKRFSPAAIGQCDLMRRRDGKWFLLATIDVQEAAPTPASDVVGVDLGVVNIAVTSDGDIATGDAIEACRARYAEARQSPQKAAAGRRRQGRRPKSIRRKLRSLAGREARFRKHENHCISKRLVAIAPDLIRGTGRGLALEDLQGIRGRIRLRRPQRARIHGWSFFQLRQFVDYKAALASVEVRLVDPRDTSRTCSACGIVDKASRRTQSEFCCRHCGHEAHADINAALNIRAKALVNGPQISDRCVGLKPAA